ncbi:GH13395 [Drosophila grimshawi]|uniref:GH13395 n=1 Tax=Drosophila grimshawi TaxID=7222 RepID=B4JPI2_DROGR|nr:GH13395 [Drosophila grimshawi]
MQQEQQQLWLLFANRFDPSVRGQGKGKIFAFVFDFGFGFDFGLDTARIYDSDALKLTNGDAVAAGQQVAVKDAAVAHVGSVHNLLEMCLHQFYLSAISITAELKCSMNNEFDQLNKAE